LTFSEPTTKYLHSPAAIPNRRRLSEKQRDWTCSPRKTLRERRRRYVPAGQERDFKMDDKQLLGVGAAADYLGLGVTTLNRWRTTGEGPTFVKMGARVCYTRADLERYVAQNRQKSTAAMTQHRANRVAA
jgi:Helix-turn-helix domain